MMDGQLNEQKTNGSMPSPDPADTAGETEGQPVGGPESAIAGPEASKEGIDAGDPAAVAAPPSATAGNLAERELPAAADAAMEATTSVPVEAEVEARAGGAENASGGEPEASAPAEPVATASSGTPERTEVPTAGEEKPGTPAQKPEAPEESDESAPSPMAEPGFAELLDKSLERVRPVRAGDRLRAVVQRIEDQWAFLDYGGPSEALIETRELRDADGNLKIGVGERLDVTVSTAGDQVIVNRMVRAKTRDRSVVKQAFATVATVEGKVTGTNKGGFDVLVSGFRAFCPISQIDRIYCTDPQSFVGKTLPFRIIEYKEGGRRIVVSRRVLLEDERKKVAEETRRHLAVGAEIEGTVVRLQPFGAFVDIGGIDGLVHVSELRHARVSDPAEAVAVGQRVKVRVIGIEKLGDEKNERISLSAKALESDPWGGVGDQLKVGDIVQGRVLRLMNYGAFVEVLPGIEGLLHLSELDKRVRHPREAMSEGDAVEVRILEFDAERKRLSLSRRLDPSAEPVEAQPLSLEAGMAIEGKVSNVKPYGVFVRIHEPRSGADGLLPVDETGLDRGVDLAQAFPVGSTVEAEVLRIDDRGRIRLTKRSAEERAQKGERERGRPRGEGARGAGERGAEGGRGGRRDRETPDGADSDNERRESKVASGFGIMANAFKRVLDGRS